MCKMRRIYRVMLTVIAAISGFFLIQAILRRGFCQDQSIYSTIRSCCQRRPISTPPSILLQSSDQAPQAQPQPQQETTNPTQKPRKMAVHDDLTRIDGIGPKISAILNSAGVTRFAELAALDEEHIKTILKDAKIRLANFSSWAEQARQLSNQS